MKFNISPFFVSSSKNKTHWFFWVYSVILYLSGALFWSYFICWGQESWLNFHDWADITVPRLTFLQNAMRQGVLPLHIADMATLNGITDRFLAIPDVILSPQILLLKWMSVGQFILFNLLFTYFLGFLGLIWISRRFKLSPMVFTVLFLLFNFNGHILAHIAIGHLTWTAYFLFSWLVGLIMEVFDRDHLGWRWVFCVSGLLLVILLQGGYHQFVWSLYLLALTVIVAGRHWLCVVEALFGSVFLSAFRTLPAVLILRGYSNDFLLGYQSTAAIWEAMIVRYYPGVTVLDGDLLNYFGTWEIAFYIGLLAIAFLFIYGVVQVFRHRGTGYRYTALFFPVIGLGFLSLDRVFKYLRIACPLPIFSGERVSSRILSMAFVIILVLAVIELQQWLNKRPKSAGLYLSVAGLTGIMLNDLWQNSQVWVVKYTGTLLNVENYSPSQWAVANRVDEPYFLLLWLGAGITLAALGTLIFLCLREKRTIEHTSQPKEKPAFQDVN